MSSLRRSLLILIPALAIFGACGGGDDESGEGGDDSAGDSSAPATTSDDAPRSSNGNANIPAIKDAIFNDGTVHVEVSGDKDFKFDAKGNGIATGGYTLLTFASDEASVILAFQGDSEDQPGGFTLTGSDITTAGEWGADCTVTFDDGANELKGEFNCDEVEGIDLRGTRVYDIRVNGEFSVSR